MYSLLYALGYYFVAATLASAGIYYLIPLEHFAFLDNVSVKLYVALLAGFITGHTVLLAYLFYSDKDLKVMLSRTWMFFVGIIAIYLTSMKLCFPFAAELSAQAPLIFKLNTNASCGTGWPDFALLATFAVLTSFLIVVRYIAESAERAAGERLLRQVARNRGRM